MEQLTGKTITAYPDVTQAGLPDEPVSARRGNPAQSRRPQNHRHDRPRAPQGISHPHPHRGTRPRGGIFPITSSAPAPSTPASYSADGAGGNRRAVTRHRLRGNPQPPLRSRPPAASATKRTTTPCFPCLRHRLGRLRGLPRQQRHAQQGRRLRNPLPRHRRRMRRPPRGNLPPRPHHPASRHRNKRSPPSHASPQARTAMARRSRPGSRNTGNTTRWSGSMPFSSIFWHP